MVTAVERNNQTRRIITFLRRLFARFKVKKYKKTSRATSNVGYQTNVVLGSASSSALEMFAYNLFIYLFCAQFIYLFCVVIKYFIRAYGKSKVNSASIIRAPTLLWMIFTI